eukprot:m.28545 g.28545  ORF g.28545 m.28545 type:complete len:330 (-) comp9049_c0_seq2:1102-2091(-)
MQAAVDEYLTTFKSKVAELNERLNELQPGKDKAQHTKTLDDVGMEVTHLTKYLTDSTHFLPGYDVRTSQKAIKALQESLALKRKELLPKKKFAFKTKKKEAVKAKADASAASREQQAKDTADTIMSLLSIDTKGFKDQTDKTLILEGAELNGKDIALERLRNCTVVLRGAPDSLHIADVENTTVKIGPVNRSLMLHRCTNCRFFLACQQLRIHHTVDTDFFIHVTSRAIIEDCSRLRFAPYSWTYPELEADYKTTSLDPTINNWDKVNDFNWIKPDEPSPHWRVMTAQEIEDATSDSPTSTSTIVGEAVRSGSRELLQETEPPIPSAVE